MRTQGATERTHMMATQLKRVREVAGTRVKTTLLGALCAVAGLVSLAPLAAAQNEIGVQRVATSSGTFLKIGLDARVAALGGAYAAIVNGPQATFSNPAGVITATGLPAANVSYVRWLADIGIGSASFSRPVSSFGGQVAIGFAFLSTDFPETTEFYPQGTGRTVSYSDFLASISFSRLFTDRLAIGVTAKLLREEMGTGVGGPTTTGALFDAGTVYSLGYRNGKIAIALSHFGPDLKPTGSYFSNVTGAEVDYTAYSPPTSFHLGFAMDPWIAGPHRLTMVTQVVHPADQNESLLFGTEYWFQDSYSLRAGYDFAADELGFSAGFGFKVRFSGQEAVFDYAFTEGGNLDAVHRIGLGFGL